MLDEQDRRALAEIELGLSRQDPTFSARMGGPAGKPPFPTVPALCALLYVSVPMVALLLGWVAALITFDIFAVVIAVVLIRRHFGPTGR